MKTSKIIPNRTCISVFLHTVLHCFHWEHRQVEVSAKCTRRLFKVWRNWPNSKLICYSERGEPKLSFEYKFVGHTWKLLKLYPTVHAYLFFYTLYCIVSTENTGKLKSAKCTQGSLRYEEIGQIQNWYVILKGENLSFHLNINLSATLENTYMHICFSTHCIALRLFKVWRNWPNSKLICYSERGEPKLSFEYKFVGHTWKLLKLYPTVHAYLFFYTLYCIVSTENTGKLKECEVHTEAL